MSRKASEKLFPQSVEAERGMMGSILINPEAWDRLGTCQIGDQIMTVTPADVGAREMYDNNHRMIWQRALNIHARSETVELITLTDELAKYGELEKVGGSAYVSSLANQVPTSRNAGQYAAIIREKWIRRGLIKSATDVVNAAYDESNPIRGPLIEHENLLAQFTSMPSTTAEIPLPGVMLSDIDERPVHWFWQRRLAFGKTTIIDGPGGMGKGLITIDIAARASTGRPMPGEIDAAPPMNVLMIAPEDDPADTIKPRLIVAGADLTRIRFMPEVPFTDPKSGASSSRILTIPRDIPILEEVIKREHHQLLIIDPVMSCLDAGVKTSIDNEVRAALMPLKQMVERLGVVLILIRHFSKNEQASAANRGGGSVAFTNIARFQFIAVEHPDDQEARVFAQGKTNFKGASSLVYRIKDDANERPYVVWDAIPCPFSANSLLSSHKSTERRDTIIVIRAAGGRAHWRAIARALGIQDGDKTGENKIRNRLSRMAAAKEIRQDGDGYYSLLDPDTNDDDDTGVMGDTTDTKRPVSVVSAVSGGMPVSALTERIRMLAFAQGWPRLILPGDRPLHAGEVTWRTWLKQPAESDLRAVLQLLEASAAGAKGVI